METLKYKVLNRRRKGKRRNHPCHEKTTPTNSRTNYPKDGKNKILF
ncbi:uncharacterized protein G2W53_041834 [Senna tora]|uniref:Uncharacterized protein n=1 Tax=Senna tora TaxID=362788 RepID=A0A834SI32_9FABA|nr:uncharacterized protein G2W53_041834 [Senna tora]